MKCKNHLTPAYRDYEYLFEMYIISAMYFMFHSLSKTLSIQKENVNTKAFRPILKYKKYFESLIVMKDGNVYQVF